MSMIYNSPLYAEHVVMETPTPDKLLAMYFHGWKNGLSTGMYPIYSWWRC